MAKIHDLARNLAQQAVDENVTYWPVTFGAESLTGLPHGAYIRITVELCKPEKLRTEEFIFGRVPVGAGT